MDVLDELNGALRQEQDRQGLTKARIADRLGIHRSEVTKLLNGRRRNMTMESIAALAWALGRDIDFRLIGEDDVARSNGTAQTTGTGRIMDYRDGTASAGDSRARAVMPKAGFNDWQRP
jgi:transcriptional regulator with XRE-family HTH domain